MTALSRIRDLIQEKLAGRKLDVEGFTDQLLVLAEQVGEIRCALATDRILRLEIDGRDSCDVDMDRAKAKLRMLCARLGVLCNQSGQPEVSLYGGEGIIEKRKASLTQHEDTNPSEPSAALPQEEAHWWTVRFKNTPSEQGFTIIPLDSRRLPVTAS